MPIMVMGLAVRKHILAHHKGHARWIGNLAAGFAAGLAAAVFVGQIVGKWAEGGWVVLISFSVLILTANLILISPAGYRDAATIHRIVRNKAKVQGSMASIVEWQALRMQEYRYSIIKRITDHTSRLYDLFGVRKSARYEPVPVPAGDYDHAFYEEHPETSSLLIRYLEKEKQLHLGGSPMETASGED